MREHLCEKQVEEEKEEGTRSIVLETGVLFCRDKIDDDLQEVIC